MGDIDIVLPAFMPDCGFMPMLDRIPEDWFMGLMDVMPEDCDIPGVLLVRLNPDGIAGLLRIRLMPGVFWPMPLWLCPRVMPGVWPKPDGWALICVSPDRLLLWGVAVMPPRLLYPMPEGVLPMPGRELIWLLKLRPEFAELAGEVLLMLLNVMPEDVGIIPPRPLDALMLGLFRLIPEGEFMLSRLPVPAPL